MDIDPGFGHWLAGFVAGEGSFQIHRNREAWELLFTIKLRDDDIDMLYEIQDCTSCGTVYRLAAHGSSKPSATWSVGSLEDQLRLIHILDRFSIRAKKAKDYHIWRRAVFAKSAKDFERIDELGQELKEARAYKALASASVTGENRGS